MDQPLEETEAQQRRPKSGRRKLKLILLLIFVALLAGGYYAYRQFQAETKTVIVHTPGATKPIEGTEDERRHFDEAVFSFDLPSDWKKMPSENVSYTNFRFQSTQKNADNRTIIIYMDNLPLDKAVNKVLPVQSDGQKLTVGKASDNCTEIMDEAAGRGKLKVPSTWENVPFLCDNDTKSRNVIGTSSPGSVNSVALSGPTAGSHKFFFTYEDNNFNPDNTIFYNMLRSFRVK